MLRFVAMGNVEARTDSGASSRLGTEGDTDR